MLVQLAQVAFSKKQKASFVLCNFSQILFKVVETEATRLESVCNLTRVLSKSVKRLEKAVRKGEEDNLGQTLVEEIRPILSELAKKYPDEFHKFSNLSSSEADVSYIPGIKDPNKGNLKCLNFKSEKEPENSRNSESL